MQLTSHHRHSCCPDHAAAAVHHHYLAGFLMVAILLASLFAVIRSLDAFIWGQAYKPHVVAASFQSGPDAQTAARYQSGDRTGQIHPVSERILQH